RLDLSAVSHADWIGLPHYRTKRCPWGLGLRKKYGDGRLEAACARTTAAIVLPHHQGHPPASCHAPGQPRARRRGILCPADYDAKQVFHPLTGAPYLPA
ncbi:hypothetical protein AB0F45_33025, partial [Streptomyces achromogenes]|uniref:hypothetical protein n=1 Tax=Streptomyces achromogenes TaxID=67255 RepID=UPI0033E13663